MAVKQISDDRDFDWEEYIIDTPEDIVNLPMTCGWGSRAICITTGDIYILNSEKRWIMLWENENSSTVVSDDDNSDNENSGSDPTSNDTPAPEPVLN